MNGASAGRKDHLPAECCGSRLGQTRQMTRKGIGAERRHLSLTTDERDVLKNVSMTFPAKGMTAIVGESGCGKSTVVNMLIGAYRPEKRAK